MCTKSPQHRLAILCSGYLSAFLLAGVQVSQNVVKSQQGYLLITDRYPQVEVPVFALMARNWQKPRAVTVG